jgi:hypothetical protein
VLSGLGFFLAIETGLHPPLSLELELRLLVTGVAQVSFFIENNWTGDQTKTTPTRDLCQNCHRNLVRLADSFDSDRHVADVVLSVFTE